MLRANKKKIAFLGLSFKAGTDDLRESPQVQMIKRLLGEGREVKIWDRDVSLGRLAGSNRQYIDEVIPHVGSLLSANLEEVVRSGEVVVLATRIAKEQLASLLGAKPDRDRSHKFVGRGSSPRDRILSRHLLVDCSTCPGSKYFRRLVMRLRMRAADFE